MNLVHPSAELHTQGPDYLLGTSTCTAYKQLQVDLFDCVPFQSGPPPVPVLMDGAPAFWSACIGGHPGAFAVSSLISALRPLSSPLPTTLSLPA